MPRFRTTLILVVGAAVLLLLAAWQVPQWLDWTRYRTTIEALATATLGQPVTINGPVSLTLLPQPVLTAVQVDVGSSLPADLSIHVQALRLRIALLPLIAGRIDAREIVLHGPDLRIPWPAEPGMLRLQPPAWLAAFSARIENGRLAIGQLAFTGIEATLATLDTGALSASGTAQFTGQHWHFTGRLTAAGPDGAAGVNMTLDGQGEAAGLGASFTGQLAQDGTLAGTIAGGGPNLAVLLPTPAVPFRADGRLTVGRGLAVADNLAMELGGSPASGKVVLRVAPNQRLDIALAATRLDLAAWLPVLMRAHTTIAGIDVPIGIAFSAEAAPLGDGTLEHVRAAFDLSRGGLVVHEASALLPSNAIIRLSGRIARSDPAHPQFEGDARFEAPVLRATLRWLDAAVPGWLPRRWLASLPEGVAQRAELTAHVVAGGGEVSLQSLTGTMDDASVSGTLGFKWGEPPGVTAVVALDHLALDPWLRPGLPSLTELLKEASGGDAGLRLSIRQATWAGTTISGLVVDTAIEAGDIMLHQIEGTVRGAHVAASGVLGDGGKLSGGRLSIETNDVTPFADLLPTSWRPTPALWHGPAKLDIQAAGPPEALAGRIRMALADAQLEASPTIDLISGAWSGALTLHHPSARRLISAIGLPEQTGLRDLTGWLGDGSLSVVAHLSGGPGHLIADQFDLTAATVQASGDLALDRSSAQPEVSGRIHSSSVMLPLPHGNSDVPLPLGVLRGWRGSVQLAVGQLTVGAGPVLRDASGVLSVTDGALRLDDFTAMLDQGTVAGSLTFDASGDLPSLAVQTKLHDAIVTGPMGDAPIDLLSGHVDASVQLAAKGYSPSAILATLDGRGSLIVSDGTVSGFDLFQLKLLLERPDLKSAEAAVNDALRSGATGFDRLELAASIAHGDLVLDSSRLTSIAGEARVSGGMNLATQALDVRIALQPALPNPPEVGIHLIGPIDRPSSKPELAGLARWMAELAR